MLLNSVVQSGVVSRSSFVNHGKGSEQQIQQYSGGRKSRLDIEESQNYYYHNSHNKNQYIEKDVIVEEIDDFRYSDKKVPSELRGSESSQNLYRASATKNNQNFLMQSYHSSVPMPEINLSFKSITPQRIEEEHS